MHVVLIYVQTKHKSKNNCNAVALKSVKKLNEIGNVSVSVSSGLRETNLDHRAIVERARWKNILFPVLTQLFLTLTVFFLPLHAGRSWLLKMHI